MIPGSANPLLLASAATGFQVSRSLRFNSADSAYLSRTPASAGNRKTWTWAGWVKRANLGAQMSIFTAGTNASTALDTIEFISSDKLDIYSYNGSFNYNYRTTQVFRDPGAWLHLVVNFDSTNGVAGDRLKVYVNGSRVTAFDTSTNPGSNIDTSFFNNTNAHYLGYQISRFPGDFYLANIHFIDGQALDPSSFTETDATTGQLIPKTYTGSYGTNGFNLLFADNSSNTASTLGKDTSGNSNNWTPNNLSVTAGEGNDSLVDSPTNYGTDTGVGGEVRGNYCTWNPLNKGSNLTLSNGNLDVSGSSWATVLSTIGLTAGMKSYMEITVTTNSGGGVGVTTNPAAQNSYSEIAGKWWVFNYSANFVIINQTSVGNYSPRVSNGDVLQLAIDYSTGKVFFGINNVWINSTNGTDGNPVTGANPTFTITTSQPIFPLFTSDGMVVATNFGQRPFAYTAPSGFKALCTQNLPEGTITTSGSFTGNANADGPFVYLNGVPTAMTINSNAVTFATHADKLSNGFKLRTSSGSYNTAGSNTYSITTTGDKFKYARAQPNP
jgi:hypothetical protein